MLPRPKGSPPLRYRGFGRRSFPPYVSPGAGAANAAPPGTVERATSPLDAGFLRRAAAAMIPRPTEYGRDYAARAFPVCRPLARVRRLARRRRGIGEPTMPTGGRSTRPSTNARIASLSSRRIPRPMTDTGRPSSAGTAPRSGGCMLLSVRRNGSGRRRAATAARRSTSAGHRIAGGPVSLAVVPRVYAAGAGGGP